MVPSGHPIKLQPGLAGFISQALGGSFTLYIEGNLYRLAGSEADAIGKEVVRAPELPPNATENDVRELAWQQMRGCFDPEIPINIVDLGYKPFDASHWPLTDCGLLGPVTLTPVTAE